MAEFKLTPDETPRLTLSTGEPHRITVDYSRFELEVLDAMGEPVPGVPIEFRRGDRKRTVNTDDTGLAVLQSFSTESVSAVPGDRDTVFSKLDEAWRKGRAEGLEDKGLTILSLAQLAQGMSVELGKRARISVIPFVIRIRLVGFYFETSKSFLLPEAMKGIRRLRELYDEHPRARVLVVGHADNAGNDSYNLQLSLERADAIGNFLTDQMQPWLDWYGGSKPNEKRWGTREDQYMLTVLPEGKDAYYAGEVNGMLTKETKDAIQGFQTDEGLKVDGVAGPKTRSALITRYMALDGTSLPGGCELITHGCGENFPEEKVADGQASEKNRRVEVFFFEGPILPPPPGKTSPKGSLAYPAWRAQVMKTVDASLEGGPVVSAAIAIWFHDHLGQRMGADPSSPDPILQERGTPYRLSTPDGEVRTGYANADGMAEEYEVPWNTLCLIQWGKLAEAPEQYPPSEEADAEAFYLYTDNVFLGSELDSGDLMQQLLGNLGYTGESQARRDAFAEDFGSADDNRIVEVHSTGEPKTLA